MYDLEKRRNQAASSILENERLTSDLNDSDADTLLQWGLTLAEKIVLASQNLDDEQAEEAMYAPMKAVRKMMRAVNKWIFSGNSKYLETILKQTRIIYGETAVILTIDSLSNIQTIPALRQAIENKPAPSSGKDYDKEEDLI